MKLMSKVSGDWQGGIIIFTILFVIALIEFYVVRNAFLSFTVKGSGNAGASGKGKASVSAKPKVKAKGSGSSGAGSGGSGGGGGDGGDDDDDDDGGDGDDDEDEDEDEDDEDTPAPAPAPAPTAPAALPPTGVATEAQLITLLTNMCTTAGGTWDAATRCCRNGKSLSLYVPVCPA